jgi:phenylacetic acid degradation operon negative regulatory protein
MHERVKLAERPVVRLNSFLFTLFGDLERHDRDSGGLWIGSLIGLMASFGVSAAAVRQAASRLTRQGWLASAKTGNRAFYRLTERGRRRVAELSPRVYGPVIEWDGRWRVLAYAAAADGRAGRERLRKELTVLGWAPLFASLWVSPADTLAAAQAAAGAAGVDNAAHCFTGTYCGPLSDRELVGRCWNLPAIARAYDDFIRRYGARAQDEAADPSLGDEAAFAQRLWLVHDFRKLAYLDPGLPSELVPAHWPGTRAAALFRRYYALLDRKAQRYVGSHSGNAPNGSPRAGVEATRPCPNAS